MQILRGGQALGKAFGRLAVLSMLLLASPFATAHAHATLLRAEPAGGSRLGSSPTRIMLLFSDEIDPALARISLVDARGRVSELPVANDPHDVHALVAAIPFLVVGPVRVEWRVVSDDGHAVEGSFGFQVGITSAESTPDVVHLDSVGSAGWGPMILGAPVLSALLRGFALGVLMSLAGLLWFSTDADAHVQHVAAGLALTAPILLALHLLSWVIGIDPAHRLSSISVVALNSIVGRLELIRVGLSLMVTWALWLVRRRSVALVLAVSALAVSAAIGHPMSLHPTIAIPAKFVHIGASALWLGGLLWLLLMERIDVARFSRETIRVSSLALTSVGVVMLSGFLETVLFMPSILDLFRTAYGALVLAKIAGLAILVGFGAHHRYRVMPVLEQAEPASRFCVTLRGETIVLLIVVMLGALLSYVPPSSESSANDISQQFHEER